MTEKTKGIIIKQSDFGEGHRMLWIFTDKYGIVKAVAHGAEKTKSKSSASTQFLALSDFEFFDGGEVWNIKSITPSDTFWPLQEDIKKLALCTYFADLIYYCLDLRNPDENILRLFLNTLYACAYKNTPPEILKLIFEIKLMYFSGLLPLPSECSACSGEEKPEYFNKKSGEVLCKNCAGANSVHLTEDEYKVLYFGVFSDMKKMFSYILPEAAVKTLGNTIEEYVETALDRKVKSLEYYKKL